MQKFVIAMFLGLFAVSAAPLLADGPDHAGGEHHVVRHHRRHRMIRHHHHMAPVVEHHDMQDGHN